MENNLIKELNDVVEEVWLMEEVIPSILKYGVYLSDEVLEELEGKSTEEIREYFIELKKRIDEEV